MTLGLMLYAAAAPPILVGVCCFITGRDTSVADGGCAIGYWIATAAAISEHAWAAAAWFAFLATSFTYLWWRNRRGGRWKKAAKALGAKSRARVQALVRQMTPSPIPSPVGSPS